MRIKFGFRQPVYDEFTVVIILNIGNQVIGIVVDSVSDVLMLSFDRIKLSPLSGPD